MRTARRLAERARRLQEQGPQGLSRRSPRGVAMVMVLVAIMILTLVLMEFSKTSHTHLNQGVNVRDSIRANVVAETGLVLTRACLDPSIWGPMASQMQKMDMQKVCNLLLGVFLAGRVDLPVGGLSVELEGIQNLGIGKGELEEMELTPEESYIGLAGLYCPGGPADLNCATRTQTAGKLRAILCNEDIAHVFEKEQEDGQRYTREEVITNLIDWMDSDDNRIQFDLLTRQFLQGASEGEDSYYGYSDDRYRSKDAPFDSIEELRLIRGINDDLYNFLKDRVSVHAREKVNVETASAEVIEVLLMANSPYIQQSEGSVCGEEVDTGSTQGMVRIAVKAYAQLIARARSDYALQRMFAGNFFGRTFRNPADFMRIAQDPAASMLNSPMVQFNQGLLQQMMSLNQDPGYLAVRQMVNWQQLQQGITVQVAERTFRLKIKARVGNIARRIFAVLKQDGPVVRTLYYRED